MKRTILCKNMAANHKDLILSHVTQGSLPASELTFEQSHTPLTIISAMPNSLHLYIMQKSLSKLLYS